MATKESKGIGQRTNSLVGNMPTIRRTSAYIELGSEVPLSTRLPVRLILGNPLPFSDPLGKVGTNSVSWRFERNNEAKQERYVQSTRARRAGRMAEQELERLRQVANRLMDANQDALEAIERMLVHEGEGGFGDDEAETAWEAEHLEATLVDVRDILGGASEDVRSLLEDSGE